MPRIFTDLEPTLIDKSHYENCCQSYTPCTEEVILIRLFTACLKFVLALKD